jgi:hypothetical protein
MIVPIVAGVVLVLSILLVFGFTAWFLARDDAQRYNAAKDKENLLISVLESGNTALTPSFKLVYCYCWIKNTTDQRVVGAGLGLAESTVKKAFRFFAQNNIALPKI